MSAQKPTVFLTKYREQYKFLSLTGWSIHRPLNPFSLLSHLHPFPKAATYSLNTFSPYLFKPHQFFKVHFNYDITDNIPNHI